MSDDSQFWFEANLVPSDSRTVVARLEDGSEIEAFYWRPTKQWYRKDVYRDEDSRIEPKEWRERAME